MEFAIIKPPIEIAQINMARPYKNFSNAPAMCLGRYDKQHIYRILIKFPITAIPKDAIIIEAKLKLCITVGGIGQPNLVTPYAIMQNWLVDTVTWENQPLFDTNTCSTGMDMKKSGLYTFDITPIVQKWYETEGYNNGLVLKNNEFRDAAFAKVLTDTDRKYSPIVKIKYALKCHSDCNTACSQFVEAVEEMTTTWVEHYSIARNTSLGRLCTYFISNIGNQDIVAKLQISPDNIVFVDDNGGNYTVKPGETAAMVPYVFAKFTRVAVRNVNMYESSKVKLWYQMQK